MLRMRSYLTRSQLNWGVRWPQFTISIEMGISDRTRKLLWGRSGNRCAICRALLVAEATPTDPAAIVGDECHIIAQSANGPRAIDASSSGVDSENNLILLCRVDHKRVDDQQNYFTAERLHAIKLAHESWVHTSLSAAPPDRLAVRVKREAQPVSLTLVENGTTLLNLVMGAEAYDFENDDLKNREEVERVADFLQNLHDYGEIGDDLQSGDRVKARYELSLALNELAEAGFLVYGGRARHTLTGGVGPPMPWFVATLRVKRLDNVIRDARSALDRATPPVSSDSPAT